VTPRPPEQVVIGLDVGTTAVKAAAFGLDLRPLTRLVTWASTCAPPKARQRSSRAPTWPVDGPAGFARLLARLLPAGRLGPRRG